MYSILFNWLTHAQFPAHTQALEYRWAAAALDDTFTLSSVAAHCVAVAAAAAQWWAFRILHTFNIIQINQTGNNFCILIKFMIIKNKLSLHFTPEFKI